MIRKGERWLADKRELDLRLVAFVNILEYTSTLADACGRQRVYRVCEIGHSGTTPGVLVCN